jgi:hypothetical protein
MRTLLLLLLLSLGFGILASDSTAEWGSIQNNTIRDNGIENYQVIDSNRFHSLYFFYPQSRFKESIEVPQNETLEPQLREGNTIYSYYYFLFIIYLMILIGFARFFPYPFRLQLTAFYVRSSYTELLSIENDWLEAEKIFPFILSVLFFSTFGIAPLLSLFAFQSYSYSVLVISGITFSLLFLLIRFIQISLSDTLEFREVMQVFMKSSFNTNFNITLIGFPIMIFFLSTDGYALLNTTPFALNILLILYAIRTLKSIINSLRCETRQIIYLIIYLCTLEMPLLMIGMKWISDNTPI